MAKRPLGLVRGEIESNTRDKMGDNQISKKMMVTSTIILGVCIKESIIKVNKLTMLMRHEIIT